MRCHHCQLTAKTDNVKSGDRVLHNIPVVDFMYRIALNTAGPLPKTARGNEYILIAIDHYFKRLEATAVLGHDAQTTALFFENKIIHRYTVPLVVLTDNGSEWGREFEEICARFGIKHERTAPNWPQYNGMVERFVQTVKHGVIVMSSQYGGDWDTYLAQVLRGYRKGTQSSTRFSSYFVMIGKQPRILANNLLLYATEDLSLADVDLKRKTQIRIEQVENVHNTLLQNVSMAQARQQKHYVCRKTRARFKRIVRDGVATKMQIPHKHRGLEQNWEGPYIFKGYKTEYLVPDDDGGRKCLLTDA